MPAPKRKGATIGDKELICTLSQFATLVKVPVSVAQDWTSRSSGPLPFYSGVAHSSQRTQKMVDLKYAMDWFMVNIARPEEAAKLKAKERIEEAKAELAEIDVQKARAELIPAQWALDRIADVLAPTRGRVMQLPKLAPRLANRSVEECNDELKSYSHEVLNELSALAASRGDSVEAGLEDTEAPAKLHS